MVLKLRKIIGTTCLFTFIFISLYLCFDFIRVANILPIGEYSIKYGDLPDGSRFYISTPLAVVLFGVTACSAMSSYLFWNYLSRLSNKTAALVSMTPIILLTLGITTLNLLGSANA